jgi:hypothetical protein
VVCCIAAFFFFFGVGCVVVCVACGGWRVVCGAMVCVSACGERKEVAVSTFLLPYYVLTPL